VNTLTRRRFLAYSAMATAAAAATTAGWMELADRARTDPLPPGAPVLVLVTLYGGNDGLNTVVPAADPAYHSARPDLAYDEAEVLDLGEGLGLNPGLTGLKQQWDGGTLAIVRGVSYPKPDRSHFRSMDIWQTGDPVHPTSTGWIGRWLDANGHDALTAISLEPVLPPLLAGETTTGAALPLRGLALPGGALGTAFAAMGSGASGESAPQATAARSIADLHRTVDTFGPAVGGADGGKRGGALATQLDVVARCIELGAPSRVYSVSLGGFDTHADERGTQQELLSEVDAAVSGFLTRMTGSDRGRQVVLMAYSEFGRRVAANANQGTDHGTAGPVLIAGSGVRGGFVGEQPSLTDLDDGDLKATTDFRDVYATLLSGVLGADPEPVLGKGRAELPLLTLEPWASR
jgi:uncharacterized protein (DUF1501 family)